MSEWLFLLVVYVSNSWALKCYTCGVIEDQACSMFEVENPLFSQECDSSNKSCRIARKVNENLILSRSCEPLKMDDCKIANSIEYCYCTKDLCNIIGPLDDEDDEEFLEDLTEGSGTYTTTTSIKQLSSSTEIYKAIEKTLVFSNCSKIRSNLCLVVIIIISWF